jgi:flagellar hook protein FlgE
MSLFGSMNTAVSGLTAQSDAITNISDDVANSQTVGYKGITTTFADYLTSSTATQNQSGAVEAAPDYENDVQGTITTSSDPLALAISGNGFFNVSETTGSSGNTFSPTQYYSREGDFSLNNEGYIVNASGEYLDGYNADPATGAIENGNLQPIKVDTSPVPAVATSSVSYSAGLPDTTSGGTATSQVSVYDSAGNTHTLTLDWQQSSTNPKSWNVSFGDDGTSLGSANVTFNADGTLASVTGSGGQVNPSTAQSGAGTPASLTLTPASDGATQSIQFNLGTFGSSSGGVSVGNSSDYSLNNITANGSPIGTYTGVTMQNSGNVVASYSNGDTRVLAHIPLATFAAPDALQRQDGQAFTATSASGAARLSDANANGTGSLVTGSVESSNVDIATDLTSLISAQQAYGANAKVVTTANQMMQTTLGMTQ